jgi:hypothetical protein
MCPSPYHRSALAQELAIEIRWLPQATPELNAIDHLWRIPRDKLWRPALPNPLMLPRSVRVNTSWA